ncbi:phage tail protein [uncultured Paraglaciecola sp.]|uniref:phage tail-collar fiber domain-containing protein n=1 Tax=uncultured Paraglaciecola sp. TaxID=1765024 RepID=UPI0026187903|nr:phage tail protein [uncultured Paraglaciecola sp.]
MTQPPESQQQYGSILTILGENAEQNGKLQNKQITFTHMAIGDANDEYVQPDRKQTALVNELARIPVNSVDILQPTPDSVPMLKVEAILPDDVNDLVIREFAAVATFDGNTYFHAVGNNARIYVPPPVNNGNVNTPVTLEMIFVITSAEPIVEMDPNVVTASREWVNKTVLTRTETVSSFVDIGTLDLNATHLITRGYYTPGDKGNAEFTYTGQVNPSEAGKSYLNIGLTYDKVGREFEIISSPLNYRQFGAVLDGQSIVMESIKDCHDCANLKQVSVVNEDGIALIDDSFMPIINTNVDWGMTEFRVHPDVGRPATWDIPVLFRAEGNPLNEFSLPIDKTEFYKSSSHLSSLSSLHNSMISIETDLPLIKRYKSDSNHIYKSEVNRVSKNGELNKPLRFDYSSASNLTVKYRDMEKSYITIKGGFLDENNSPSHTFIDIARNNVIWNLIGFKDCVSTDEKNIRATMKISMAADIRLVDINAEAHTRLEGTDGTYGLYGEGVVDLYLDNLNAYCGYGFSGLKQVNGITMVNSKVNRLDGHYGIYDIEMRNCYIKEWGILIGSGGGYLRIKNCTKFFSRSTKLNQGDFAHYDIVQFRPDYGSEWRGDIDISGLRLEVDPQIPVDETIKIVSFNCNGDYGAADIVDWGKSITIKDIVIAAPRSHLDSDKFGVIIVDYGGRAITTGTRIPSRINIDNVNYESENTKAYISAVVGPNDLYVKMPATLSLASKGDHNSVWSLSNIFNATKNPLYDEGNYDFKQSLIQYGQIPEERNTGDDRIKIRLIISKCTMYDVEITVDHYLESHGGSCIAYDTYEGGLPTDAIGWFFGTQIIPLPHRVNGKAEFGHMHLNNAQIIKTAAPYVTTNLQSAIGVRCEVGSVSGGVSPSQLFYGYLADTGLHEPVQPL